MSELQIGLLAIGALVVAAVLIYNRVQEARARREAEQAFRSGHDDVLLHRPAAHGGEAAPGHQDAPAPEAPQPSPLFAEGSISVHANLVYCV